MARSVHLTERHAPVSPAAADAMPFAARAGRPNSVPRPCQHDRHPRTL